MQLITLSCSYLPRWVQLCSIRREFLEQLQVERFSDEYSDGHLKGILGKLAAEGAAVVYETVPSLAHVCYYTAMSILEYAHGFKEGL